MLAIIPLIAWFYFIPRATLVTYSYLIVIPVLFAVFKYTILVHNLLLENFVIIHNGNGNRNDPTQPQTLFIEPDVVSRQKAIRLDAYMRKHKPYLNPKLKITDLTLVLNTNRTALSILINSVWV
ncbi:MAG: hypothetical protein LUE93_15565 [Bacteroides sp.]|nr:hypothetical protein [Bacteroides sp.]